MKHDKGFARPEDTISDLSGIKYIFKSAMFYECMHQTGMHLDFDRYFSLYSLSLIFNLCFLLSAANHYCSQWLNKDLNTSYAGICAISSFLNTIVFCSKTEAQMSWDALLSELSWHGELLKLEKLRSGIKKAIIEVKDTLCSLSGGSVLSYDMPSDYSENMSDTKYGYSFLNESWIEQNALLKHLIKKSTDLLREGPNGKVEFKPSQALDFLTACEKLRGKLGCIIQITSGQPMRTTETIDMRIRNTERNRAFYKDHGEIICITNYQKTSNNKGYDAFIPHLIPHEVAQLLEYYLIVIRPLETLMASQIYGFSEAQTYHFYFHVHQGKRITAKVFRDIFASFLKDYVDFNAGVAAWRQCVSAIKKEYILPIFLKKANWDDAGDLQAGHSSYTATRNYGLTKQQMSDLTTEILITFIQFSHQWIEFLGLDGKTPTLPLRFTNPAFAASVPSDILIKGYNPYTSSAVTSSSAAVISSAAASSSDSQPLNSGQISQVLSSIQSLQTHVLGLQTQLSNQKVHMEAIMEEKLESKLTSSLTWLLEQIKLSSTSIHSYRTQATSLKGKEKEVIPETEDVFSMNSSRQTLSSTTSSYISQPPQSSYTAPSFLSISSTPSKGSRELPLTIPETPIAERKKRALSDLSRFKGKDSPPKRVRQKSQSMFFLYYLHFF